MKNVIRISTAAFACLLILGCASTDRQPYFDQDDSVTVSANYQEYGAGVYAVLPFSSAPASNSLSLDEIEDYEEYYGPFTVVNEEGLEVFRRAFENELLETGYDIVVRQNLREILAELEFQAFSGMTSDDTAAVGAILNADALVMGQVEQFNNYYVAVSVRAVDVERGVVLWSASGYRDVFDFDEDPAIAVRWLVRELTEQINWKLSRE